MTKKTYTRYKKLCKKGATWTEGDIRGFRRFLSSVTWKRDRAAWDGRSLPQVAQELLRDFEAHAPYRITDSQAYKGVTWLRSVCWTKSGTPRRGKSLPFDQTECDALRTFLPRFKTFTFDGLEPVYNGFGDAVAYQPIYTLQTKRRGEAFTYVSTSWQGAGRTACISLHTNPQVRIPRRRVACDF